MSARPAVLLTNDDGIEATGIRALYDALEPVADVTMVAPATDRSGMSRSDSRAFTVEERAEGYAVDGTPVDCVHFARGKLEREFDVVVSGCNDSPNLGAHKIERSGTVCAAIEAGFLGLPGIALSLYDSVTGSREFVRDEYADAERITRYLVRETLELGDRRPFDYLNVNVPAGESDPRIRITEPTYHFDVRIDERPDGTYRAWDHFYDPLDPSVDVDLTDPVGTDRRAVADGEVSITPLFVDHRTPEPDALESLASGYSSDGEGRR
ncbi:5'/3'-nucleotidase SurE [Saliphagus sp. GCM10025334]